LRVFDYIPALLHATQQLDGKQGMAAREQAKHLPELASQPVGLAIQNRINKSTTFSLIDIYLNVAVLTLKLVDYRLEGMPFASPAQGDFFWSISAQYQDAATCQMPAQMEEQADRAKVCPLEIINDQNDTGFTGQGLQHLTVLDE
jgi:hypothetical protein